MQNQLTVRDLVNMLQSLDQDMPVEMTMGMEYQERMTADMVTVCDYDGVMTLVFDDCPVT